MSLGYRLIAQNLDQIDLFSFCFNFSKKIFSFVYCNFIFESSNSVCNNHLQAAHRKIFGLKRSLPKPYKLKFDGWFNLFFISCFRKLIH